MGIKQLCGKGVQIFIAAAFTTVLVPKQAYINNRNLAILQKFGFLCLGIMVGYMLVNSPSQYLLVTIPTGFPRIASGQADSYAATITSEMTSGAHCTGNSLDFLTASEKFQSPTCINPSFFYDGDADVGVGQLFIPTTIQENTQSRKSGGDCTAMGTQGDAAGNCVPSAQGGTDWDDGVSGASRVVTSGSDCTCEQHPSTYFVAGVGKKTVTFDHMMVVENSETKMTEFSYSSLTDKKNSDSGALGLLTVILKYDAELEKWVEGSCPSSAATQVAGQCRFGAGAAVEMTVDDWLANGGVSSLDADNAAAGMGAGTGSNTVPSYRVSGVELVVQLEYLDSAFHNYADWMDPVSGTVKVFPGVMAFAKVQANPVRTQNRRLDFSEVVTASAQTGTVRRRVANGIGMSAINSANSKRGFLSYLALIQYLAVTVVYAQFVTLGCMVFSLQALGNTSRNYRRVIRETCNVAVQSARRTPAKCMIAAVAFFLMREWEHDREAMHKFMDDQTTVHRDTIGKFMMTCYNPDLLPEIDKGEVEDMVNATWSEMGGAGGDGITLIEFVESALSSEAVDYISTRAAFNKERVKNPLEKIFGDNVGHYSDKDKKMCFGLIPNPASMADASENKLRGALRANLTKNIPGLNAGLGVGGKALGQGLNFASDMGKFGFGAANKLTGGVAGKGLGTATNITGNATGAVGGLFGFGKKKKAEVAVIPEDKDSKAESQQSDSD